MRKLQPYYSLYDVFASLLPGAYLALSAFWVWSHSASAAAVGRLLQELQTLLGTLLVLAVVFVVGHMLHPIGNLIEWLFDRRRGDQGSAKASERFSCGDSLSPEFVDGLDRMLQLHIGVGVQSRDAFRLCYCFLQNHGFNVPTARLRAMQGFYRQFTAAAGVTAILALAVIGFSGPDNRLVVLVVANAIIAGLMGYRYGRFSRLFSESVVRSFLVVTRQIGKLGSSESSPRRAAIRPPGEPCAGETAEKVCRSPEAKLLAVDFDGVLADYSGWKGESVLGRPKAGIAEFLRKLRDEGWIFAVYSTRTAASIAEWLAKSDIGEFFECEGSAGRYRIAERKPQATAYLDDRAVRFGGSFDEALKALGHPDPYWKSSVCASSSLPEERERDSS